jgi:DNA-binding LytR/AlgR family response regulator
MKVIIIEDEKLTAKDLAKTLVAIDGEIEIVKTIHSVEEGLLYFENSCQSDLIFSDIELGDGLSFDIFQKYQNTSPIIFCTAYQQYMLDAFKTAGIDYVLKPFSKVSIEKALLKFKSLKNNFEKPTSDITKVFDAIKNNLLGKVASVIVHQGDKMIPIKGNDIAFFFIENDSVFAFTFEQKKYLVNQKLESLEKIFPDYFRANRQFLVNRKAVKDASYYFNRKLVVNLNIPFKEQIIIGKLKTTDFIQWLTNS